MPLFIFEQSLDRDFSSSPLSHLQLHIAVLSFEGLQFVQVRVCIALDISYPSETMLFQRSSVTVAGRPCMDAPSDTAR